MKIFTSFFLLCLNVSLFSQIEVEPKIIDFQIPSDYFNYKYEFSIKNVDTVALDIYWMYEVGEGWEDEWQQSFYDANLTFGPDVTKCPDSKPNKLNTGDSIKLIFKLNGNEKEGTSSLKLKLFSMPGCQNEIFSTNDEGRVQVGGISHNINIHTNPKAYPFPNPTQDFLKIKNDEQLESIKLIDHAGTIIYECAHSKGQIHDLCNYNLGFYILEMHMKNGEKNIDRIVKY